MNNKPYTRTQIKEIIGHSRNFYYDNDEVWQSAIKQLMREHDELVDYLNSYRDAVMRSIDISEKKDDGLFTGNY